MIVYSISKHSSTVNKVTFGKYKSRIQIFYGYNVFEIIHKVHRKEILALASKIILFLESQFSKISMV